MSRCYRCVFLATAPGKFAYSRRKCQDSHCFLVLDKGFLCVVGFIKAPVRR